MTTPVIIRKSIQRRISAACPHGWEPNKHELHAVSFAKARARNRFQLPSKLGSWNHFFFYRPSARLAATSSGSGLSAAAVCSMTRFAYIDSFCAAPAFSAAISAPA